MFSTNDDKLECEWEWEWEWDIGEDAVIAGGKQESDVRRDPGVDIQGKDGELCVFRIL
jgi:hypothetical protein